MTDDFEYYELLDAYEDSQAELAAVTAERDALRARVQAYAGIKNQMEQYLINISRSAGDCAPSKALLYLNAINEMANNALLDVNRDGVIARLLGKAAAQTEAEYYPEPMLSCLCGWQGAPIELIQASPSMTLCPACENELPEEAGE